MERPGSVEYVDDGGAARLSLRGRFTLDGAGETWTEIRRDVDVTTPAGSLAVDMAHVEAIDGGTMALLVRLRADLAAKGVKADFSGATRDVKAMVHLYEETWPRPAGSAGSRRGSSRRSDEARSTSCSRSWRC